MLFFLIEAYSKNLDGWFISGENRDSVNILFVPENANSFLDGEHRAWVDLSLKDLRTNTFSGQSSLLNVNGGNNAFFAGYTHRDAERQRVSGAIGSVWNHYCVALSACYLIHVCL